MTRRTLFWAIPLLLVVTLLAALAALPRFVASRAHRATIEALASSLTGREVHVYGPLSLALLPAPQIVAANVSIGDPVRHSRGQAAGRADGQSPQGRITARSLTLDIALVALLHGRLAASSLTLRTPTIILPWPLPGGAAAILPPPWLTALHAQISNGTVSIGRLRLTAVNADLFTGGNGTLAVSGTGSWGATPLTLSLGLAAPDADGRAALTMDSRTPDRKLGGHFSGSLQDNSDIVGALTGTFLLPSQKLPIFGTATLAAGATRLTASAIHLAQADASLTGTADFDLGKPGVTLDLAGDRLAAVPLLPLFAAGTAGLSGTLALRVTNLVLPIGTLPALQVQAEFGPQGLTLNRLTARLPRASTLAMDGRIDAAGGLTANASLASMDLAGLAAAFGGTARLPAAWQQARLHASLSGDFEHLSLNNLSGNLGASQVDGSVVLRRIQGGITAAGALHFDQLDLSPVIDALRQARPMPGFNLTGEVTAERATYGQLVLGHLLLDAALNSRLVVRRLSAALYDGVAIASFTLAPDGELTAARGLLAAPSATPLAALLPNPLPLPAVLLHAPLSLSVAAAGTPDSLATSAVASLGDISVTAAPVIDLNTGSAAGALTLRHPDAIAALQPFGLHAGLAWPGLAWPGAGSIALRADFAVTPKRFSLPDFVLSFGDLTANGKFSIDADHQVSAEIAADTLALPPLPAKAVIPWTQIFAAGGKIALSANRIWLDGEPILDGTAATATLAPNKASLALTRAAIGNGNLAGVMTATMLNGAPALSLRLDGTGIDASTLAPPFKFPFTLPAGTLNGQTALTASGFAPPAWIATLSGGAAFSAANGQLGGFDLAALTAALQARNQAGWQKAATGGASPYTSLTAAGSIDHGTLTLQSARLAGPAGATATGSIDLPDQVLALQLALQPATTPATQIQITMVGPWANPRQILPKTP